MRLPDFPSTIRRLGEGPQSAAVIKQGRDTYAIAIVERALRVCGLAVTCFSLPVSASGAPRAARARRHTSSRCSQSSGRCLRGRRCRLEATKPAKGQEDRPELPRVKKYADYLRQARTTALRRSAAEKVYDYSYTYNGFAAKLTEGRALSRSRPRRPHGRGGRERRYVDHAGLPRAHGDRAASGSSWSPPAASKASAPARRRHRHRRLRHLARAQELLRPRRQGEARLPADSPAGTASAPGREFNASRTATRS